MQCHRTNSSINSGTTYHSGITGNLSGDALPNEEEPKFEAKNREQRVLVLERFRPQSSPKMHY